LKDEMMHKKLLVIFCFCMQMLVAQDQPNSVLRQFAKWEPFSKIKKSDLTLEELNNPDFVQVVPLNSILKKNGTLQYKKIYDKYALDRIKFPLSKSVQWWMQDINIPEVFILFVSGGCVYSQQGIVIFNNNQCADELVWQASALRRGGLLNIKELPDLKKIQGKVAVVTQAGCWNYYHWMVEILPKFAILQDNNIDFDKIYIPYDRLYMQETLSLLGIDKSKIIEPIADYKYIQADELIIPSFISRFGYTPKFAIDFLREKLLPQAEQLVDVTKFSKKIFISRKKASYRKILNEDEIFDLFQKQGFVRYDLEDLTVLEQIALFNHAEVIVAEHGAGLVNLVFCQSGTQVIEIFQVREDATFWFLSQELGLKHTCVKTVEFDEQALYLDVVVPLQSIYDVIEEQIKNKI